MGGPEQPELPESEDSTAEAYSYPGDRLGGYVLLSELGRGSMGVVYEAFQEGLNRKVALKVLPANITLDEKHVRRFHREAEAVARLNHPNIIQIYENGDIDGTHYFAMEMVDGTDFSAVRCRDNDEIKVAARLVRDAARALGHAHGVGVIHRDIKPSNLLVDRQGRVVVSDFGLARVKDSASLTSTDAIVGTPKYMAPEQILRAQQNVDGRADIYALGATLYHSVTGRPPLEAPTVQAFFKAILEERPQLPRRLNRQCPHDLATIIMRCLEKDPDHRYANADAMADDLNRFLTGERIHARPKSRTARSTAWVRRHKVITSLSVVAIGAIVYAVVSGDTAKDAINTAEEKANKATTRVDLLTRLSRLETTPDVRMAIIEAQELQRQYPDNPDVEDTLALLHGRAAEKDIESAAPDAVNWLEIAQFLERARRTTDLWYLMALVQLDNDQKALAAAKALPEESEARAVTLALLEYDNAAYGKAIDLLGKFQGERHPFTYLVLAQSHLAMATVDKDNATRHLTEALGLVDRARVGALRSRWLRAQVQYTRHKIREARGERVNLRDSVDDFAVLANQWWDRVSGIWEGMTQRQVDNVKVYIRSVLAQAGLPESFAVEIETHAREWLKKKKPRDKTTGHLLLGVARLSNGDPESALVAFEEAENSIDEDLFLLPYVHWGKSLAEFAGDDLMNSVINGGLALQGALSEKRFGDIEPIAAHLELLHDECRARNKGIAQLRAKTALKTWLAKLAPQPEWATLLLSRLAAPASPSDGSR
ncbi:MAG: serine/threonine protein kinase [Planctomycetota bacterium]|jgi:serine/threonine protein kinase